MKEISNTAHALGLEDDDWAPYGRHAAKVSLSALGPPVGRLVLVTAMSPSPGGEGKTTVAIGLTDALRKQGSRAVVALRQPSLGPVFGTKGGGAGTGAAQLAHAQDVNLHFTGDFHAVTTAHNLLAAAIDNHLFHGNALGLDPERITWPRALDLNDRALRNVVVGRGPFARTTRFDLSAASEVMAILGLAASRSDLRRRLGRVVIGRDRAGGPVTAEQLRAAGSMAALLSRALEPNLTTTREGSPALVHTGPFGNIAHGTSSLIGTRIALARAEVVVQEAGFGADLGAQKLLDIVCPRLGVAPALAVMVVSLRGLRHHGIENPVHHLRVLAARGLPAVVALNAFDGETESALAAACDALRAFAPVFCVRAAALGAVGAVELAEWVRAHLAGPPTEVVPLWEKGAPLSHQLATIVRSVYGGSGVALSPEATQDLAELEARAPELDICVAKTPYSFTADPLRTGPPVAEPLPVRAVRWLAGAGLAVPLCGSIVTMPGLSASPNLERIDVDDDGQATGMV